MSNKKKWRSLWLFGGVCLLIQILSYGAVSLNLAEGLLLGAGQAALLCAAAVWMAFKKRNGVGESMPDDEKRAENLKRKASEGKTARGSVAASFSVKHTLLGAWYGVAFICLAFMATVPLQKGLSMLGVSSLLEAGVFSELWAQLLFCWILPTVVAELLISKIVFLELGMLCSKKWQFALLSGVFYAMILPSVGDILARVLLGALLALLCLRKFAGFSRFAVGLAANGFLFFQDYLQTLGLAGAEAYSLAQAFGIGLTFAAPGAVILYFCEKKEGKGGFKAVELLCVAACALFSFALGMALWLG